MDIPIKKIKEFEVIYYYNPIRVGDMQKEVDSATYIEQWQLTDFFCLNCGFKPVWKRIDNGKAYLGSNYVCTSCEHEFSLPEGISKIQCDNKVGQQRLKNLK